MFAYLALYRRLVVVFSILFSAPCLLPGLAGSMYREIYNRLRDHVSALNKDDIPVDEKNPLERKFAGGCAPLRMVSYPVRSMESDG